MDNNVWIVAAAAAAANGNGNTVLLYRCACFVDLVESMNAVCHTGCGAEESIRNNLHPPPREFPGCAARTRSEGPRQARGDRNHKQVGLHAGEGHLIIG